MKKILSLLKLIPLAMVCSVLLACNKSDFHDLNDETLAKTMNKAFQSAAREASIAGLSLVDCKNFYNKVYPENNPFMTKEDFIQRAKKDCPLKMEHLHQNITGYLAKRITVEDLKAAEFWQQYEKSQALLVKKVINQ